MRTRALSGKEVVYVASRYGLFGNGGGICVSMVILREN